jgi:hypothetical protein
MRSEARSHLRSHPVITGQIGWSRLLRRSTPFTGPGLPGLNLGSLRPEPTALAKESAPSRGLRWSQTSSAYRSPRLTAPGGALPLLFRSQDWTRLPGRGGHEAAVRLPGDGHLHHKA